MEKVESKGVQSLGIYIHIPFCVKKCEYCDFLSMQAGRDVQNRYCECLLKEIKTAGREYGNQQYVVDTVFIGGGTPSILNPQWIKRILKEVYGSFRVMGHGAGNAKDDSVTDDLRNVSVEKADDIAEITIECNPGTLDEEKLRIYKQAGVNRISLGLQSADNRELKLLGRIHTWEQFLESAQLVKRYFKNWNVDLMSALPGQTLDSYRHSLEKVLALQPTHVSAYSLMIEEGTPFYDIYEEDDIIRQKGGVPKLLPDEETERQMYEMTAKILGEYGYERYEISNYAKRGHASRHNERYWKCQDYLGIGLGAASCMGNVRFHNTEDIENYLQILSRQDRGVRNAVSNDTEHLSEESDTLDVVKKSLREDVSILSQKEQMEEMMFLGLRRMEGVRKEQFAERFGQSVSDVFGEPLQKLESEQLLKHFGNYIQLTQKGIDVSNYVLAQFLLD